MKIAFFVKHFNERGTEVATYDYADYNEKILGNESIIVGLTKDVLLRFNSQFGYRDDINEKFKKRFPVFQVDKFEEVEDLLKREKVDLIYLLVSGYDTEKFPFGYIYNTPTFIHCVFTVSEKYGDLYVALNDTLNKKARTNFPVLPHIITIGETNENLRKDLNIPENAKVFGRHGAINSFDIPFVHEAIIEIAKENPNIYFLFLNTEQFSHNISNIIYLPCEVNPIGKRKFINTCDAMLHARLYGEIHSIAIGEFALCKKPIISYIVKDGADCGHYDILKDKIITYKNKDDLKNILINYDISSVDMSDNGYFQFTPEYIMKIFNDLATQLVPL